MLTSCLLSMAQLLTIGCELLKRERQDTHILLLLPVPRSIMMCLFLQARSEYSDTAARPAHTDKRT